MSETSHKIVARKLGNIDRKNERSGLYDESYYIEWGRGTAGLKVQKARVLEMYWVYFIGCYLWEERTQALE